MNRYQFYSVCIPISLLIGACTPSNSSVQTSGYLNHRDSAHYVGIQTCRTCHSKIYDTYIKTGMGQSFGLATTEKSAYKNTNASVLDTSINSRYLMSWNKSIMQITEQVFDNRLTYPVKYIIGSGQHTNSHIREENGYCFQMPMTYYTQQQLWDLPPGFEQGQNSRFRRKLSLECISCHNAFPKMEQGSENKYAIMPTGIDCERCHGPGSIHVAQRSSLAPIDTARYIDYSIVNPAKLSIDRQFDICQRCHLQGNAVLTEGKSYYDFKPGMVLSDFITVFLPRYSNSESTFIMASHADRLKQSKCFISSLNKVQPNSLKPYKNALTCVTCHNPHVSVKDKESESYNLACINCHTLQDTKVTHTKVSIFDFSNCVQCHMPLSGASDIPHVSIHDHKIQIPAKHKKETTDPKFISLTAINSKSPTPKLKTEAFINQFERFNGGRYLLDSAYQLLKSNYRNIQYSRLWIRYFFLKQDYLGLLEHVQTVGYQNLILTYQQKEYENRDAWMWYHISEAYNATGKQLESLKAIQTAVKLAPLIPEFLNKNAVVLFALNKTLLARNLWHQIINQQPGFAPAQMNLGYYYLKHNQLDSARVYLNRSYRLNPFNITTLTNLEQLYSVKGKSDSARYFNNIKRSMLSLQKHSNKNL